MWPDGRGNKGGTKQSKKEEEEEVISWYHEVMLTVLQLAGFFMAGGRPMS